MLKVSFPPHITLPATVATPTGRYWRHPICLRCYGGMLGSRLVASNIGMNLLLAFLLSTEDVNISVSLLTRPLEVRDNGVQQTFQCHGQARRN